MDDSSNMNVRTKSRLPELYYQWSSYRLHLLSERFSIEAQKLDLAYQEAVEESEGGKRGDLRKDVVDVEGLKEWMELQIKYMKQTVWEMRPVTAEDNINKNEIQEVPL